MHTIFWRNFSLAVAALALGAVDVDGATPPGGIRVLASLQPPQAVPGGSAEIAVTFDLPAGWIVYDLEQPPASVLPTQLELEPMDWLGAAESFRSEGALEGPEPRFGDRIARYFDRSPTFRRPVLIAPDAPLGAKAVRGRARFLARNEGTDLFYLVNDAPFEATLTIVATTEGAEIPPSGDTEPSAPPHRVARSNEPRPTRRRELSEPFRFQVESGDGELQPSSPHPPLFPPVLLGFLLVFAGISLGACIPPQEWGRGLRARAERRAA